MPDHPGDENVIFEAARRIDSAEAQAEYLAEACVDDEEMLRRIQQRLVDTRTTSSPGTDLEATSDLSSTRPATSDDDEIESDQEVIAGRYRLLKKIGEGGMGSVWMAEQSTPVTRIVAVKLIKPGMDSRQVLARFDAERQALALMDHPNIAKVLDGGITEQGRPFFAMEYVEGVPLTQYCDSHAMSVRQRLQLFVTICRAVQHAHQKGIIHRDLKPSNILVGIYDGEGVPKVIDFGLAKATQQSLTDHTIDTAEGVMLGTPLYMSPEQADPGNMDIDTRTDVYSLGVILYELLTGTTPLAKQQFKKVAASQLLRMIKEVEPLKPSSRLSGSESLPSVAALRSIDPSQLRRNVAGDLDWVVMRALEKERGRRYPTANGLAEDIRRHLEDEPVVAGPPSARYRLQKFVKRNRAGVMAASLVAAALLIGFVGTAYGLVRAEQARAEALQRAESETLAKQEAQQAAEAERLAKLQAQTNLKRARDSVERFFTRVSEDTLLDVPGLQPLRKELLQDALGFYMQLVAEYRESPDLRFDLAVAESKVAVMTAQIGSHEESLAVYRDALDSFESLGLGPESDTAQRLSSVDTLRRFSLLQFQLGRVDEAIESMKRARDLGRKLFPGGADDLDAELVLSEIQQGLGQLWIGIGSYDEAIEIIELAITELEKKHGVDPVALDVKRQLASLYGDVGTPFKRQGRLEEAIKSMERAGDILRTYVDGPQVNLSDREEIGLHDYNLANFQQELGRFDEADKSMLRACARFEELVQANPTVTDFRITLAFANNNLGILHGRQGRHENALKYFLLARDQLEQVLAINPKDSEAGSALASTVANVGKEQEHAGQLNDALRSYERSLELHREQYEAHPDLVNTQYGLGLGLQNFANTLGMLGRQEEALPIFEEARGIRAQLVDGAPGNAGFRSQLARVFHARGVALSELGRHSEAEEDFRASIEQEKCAVRDGADGNPFRGHLAFHYDSLITTLKELNRFDDAVAEIATLRKMEAATPEQLFNAACVHCLFAESIKGEKDRLPDEEAASYQAQIDEALETLREAIQSGWSDFELLQEDPDLNELRGRPEFKALLVRQ